VDTDERRTSSSRWSMESYTSNNFVIPGGLEGRVSMKAVGLREGTLRSASPTSRKERARYPEFPVRGPGHIHVCAFR
jgi:hypothetical protein